jgi:gas vesicle protein
MRDWLKLAGFLVFASALSLAPLWAQGEQLRLLLGIYTGALLLMMAIVQFGILPDLQRYRKGFEELLGYYRDLRDGIAEFIQDTEQDIQEIRKSLQRIKNLQDAIAEFVQDTEQDIQGMIKNLQDTEQDIQGMIKNLQDTLEQTNACVERVEVNIRRRGRPRGSTRWSPERIDLEIQNLARWLERGYTLETFAQSKGIDVSTLRRYRREWCKRREGGG